MKCKVYGYEIRHCACVEEECCMMESCADCYTKYGPKEEKKEYCGKCNTIELDFSDETKELAKKVVEKCEVCKNEDVEKWAEKLANDVCNADD